MWNVEVANLTVDCNYTGLGVRTPYLGLQGVMLHGERARISDVEVVNAVGMRKLPDGSYQECFPITAGSMVGDVGNVLIENCEVADNRGDDKSYISAVTLMADPIAGAHVSGKVRNSTVKCGGRLTEFGLNMAQTVDCTFEGNTVLNAGRCLSNDSADNVGLIIRNNRFTVAQVGCFMMSSRRGVIEHNAIDLLRPGTAGLVFCSEGGQQCEDFLVQGNTIRNLCPPEIREKMFGIVFGWNGSPGPKNVRLVFNDIDPSLENIFERRVT